jgi:hypothetical protein
MGSTSGSCTLQEQAVAGTTTLTLPTFNGTVGLLVSGTAVSASGTSVNFTGIPAGVRRITVMFSGVSTSGTGSNYILQLGDSGGLETSGYLGSATSLGSSSVNSSASSTAGITILRSPNTADTYSGVCTITNLSSNSWVISSSLYDLNSGNPTILLGGGSKSLSDTLTQIRITTGTGTDTFDAGSINILYE